MVSAPSSRALLDEVEDAFASMPARFLGAPAGFDATWHIVLGDVGRTWEVRVTEHGARVRPGITGRKPDVVIGCDAQTWLDLRCGRLTGIEAFADQRLSARGDLDLAVRIEGLFRLPDGRDPLVRIDHVDIGGGCVSALQTGRGPDVLLIHGLGATKSSFFFTAAALGRHGYRVTAIDLPGFGASSKALTAPYHARFFADAVLDVLDRLDIETTHVVGNSMGGRVGIELGLQHPERVRSLVLLCPAVAFVKRGLWPLVQVLRPELGVLPHRFARGMVAKQLWDLFADPDTLDPATADVVVDEFLRIYATAGARRAFLTAARNIYLDKPFGRGGFYTRLADLQPPALFLWGTHDPLIPAGFRRHVEAALPSAQQIVLQHCGHVPQIERADQVNGMLKRFFGDVDAMGGRPAQRRLRLAA